MRSGWRKIANVCALFLLFVSTALGAKWEETVTAASPPSFPGPRPLHAKYGFGWSGFPGANADVRLTKPSRDRFNSRGHPYDWMVRTLWKFDATQTARADAATLHPVEMKQVENVRTKKIVTNLSFDSPVSPRGKPRPRQGRSQNPAL